MDAQVIPPSDWIDFYPPSADRLAALAALKGPVVTRAQHVAMGFPYKFGKATPQAAAAFAPDPSLHFMYTNFAANIDPRDVSFSQLAKDILSGDRYSSDRFMNPLEERCGSANEMAMVKRQTNTVASILRFGMPHFGGQNRLYADFDFENAMIRPDDIRARRWHADNDIKSLAVVKSVEDRPTPGIVIQVRSFGPGEFLQNEWIRKNGKLVMHPAALAMLDAQDELTHAIRKGATAKVKSRLQAKIDRLTNKARRKGLVIDGKPNEFIMITTDGAHRSYYPKKRLLRPIKPVASSFMRTKLVRYPDLRP